MIRCHRVADLLQHQGIILGFHSQYHVFTVVGAFRVGLRVYHLGFRMHPQLCLRGLCGKNQLFRRKLFQDAFQKGVTHITHSDKSYLCHLYLLLFHQPLFKI